MAIDVVVDQKPLDKLPYDPNDIPEAVRKRVTAVEAMYTPGESPAPQTPTPLVQPASVPQPPAAPAASADLADENSESWKTRFLAMQGRYAATQKTIGEMQEQMTQLGQELMHAQQARPPQPKRQPAQSYLTDQDVENYGSELIDVTQRAALQAIQPQLAAVEQQNAELQRRLAIEARRRLDQAVEASVPNYKEIDRNPRWHRWLLGIDTLSGRVRQQLLNEAISGGTAPRVISFFKGFLQEEAATGHIEPASTSLAASVPREAAVNLASLAAPGRARPATGGDTAFPPDKPIYTRAQIANLYRMHQKGAYVGREAEWQRQDADIIAAGREGRIR